MDEHPKLPSALECFSRIARELDGKRVGVFLDYDGTLTPIVERPELAVLSADMRLLLHALGRACTLAIVSGRELGDLVDLVRVEDLYYAGSHGFDIIGPAGSGIRHEFGSDFLPAIEGAHAALCARLGSVDGVIIENKKYSLSVHYRLVPESLVPTVDRTVDEVLARYPTLRRTYGKMVFEVRPELDWNKGEAVRLILRLLGFNTTDAAAIYVGDDTTDEDAFKAMTGTGIGVLVAAEVRPTAATYGLADPVEVRLFLERILEEIADGR